MRKVSIDVEMSDQKKMILNIICSLFSFGLSLVISFFVTPYIVINLGAEASGYNTLALNFISYATIIQVALNSMGSRFISLSYNRGEQKKAQKFYNAMFYGDAFLCVIFTLIAIYIVWNVEHLINISPELVLDVKILFSLLFATFIVSTFTSVLLSATFIKNKIYLEKIKDVIGYIIKIAILSVCFGKFSPKIYYVALGGFIATIMTAWINLYYKRRLLDDVKVSSKLFEFKYVKMIVSSGVWNSISQSGELLFSSFDLLITNIMISPLEMGVLSISKTVPNLISGLSASLQSVFTPALVSKYAKEGSKAVGEEVVRNGRIMMSVVTIPLCFLIVYGGDFYKLWQPTQDAIRLQILSVLACAAMAVTCCAMGVYNVFMVVNKVRQLSIATLVTGIVSLLTTYILLLTTDLGIYAVAGVSSVMYMLRSLVFGMPKAAEYLGLKKTTFYASIPLNILVVILNCLVGYAIRSQLPHGTWFTLIASGFLVSVVFAFVNIIIILDKDEKKKLVKRIVKRRA